MDMSQYRELFISETREHLHNFNELIVALESDSGDQEKIDSLFRMAHSIKGMAASMGYRELAELAHKIEDLMDKVRKQHFTFEPAIADLLLEGGDLLEVLLNDVAADITEEHDLGDFIQRLTGYAPAEAQSTAAPCAEPIEKGQATTPPASPPGAEKQASRQTVRVRTEILDNLINITGELITNKHRLMSICRDIGSARLGDAVEDLSRLIGGLHNEVMNVRLTSFATITDRFSRVVRDLARKSGKEVVFEVSGKEIELDRGILEELTDPLVHIIRNAVDHGLETAEERLASGKEPSGNISLSAVREKDQVIVMVEDDGRGMNPAELVKSALAKGIITAEVARLLSPLDILLLTCRPGFSTAREVTDISGRGVGMDVVSSTIKTLGGTLAIESDIGRGSRIILTLPLTIAIINVLLVKCGGMTIAVPVTAIRRTMEVRHEEITSQGKHKVYHLDDEPIPLLSLNRIFGLPANPCHGKVLPIFISEIRGRTVALVVDRLLEHQEVFVKPLGHPLGKIKGLSGGAILGTGEVVFILDVPNII